jgi:cytidine deaminase
MNLLEDIQFPFFIPAGVVKRLLSEYNLSIEGLLNKIIPLAQKHALPSISNYYVGAVGIGNDGNIYSGVNLEFPCMPLNYSIHAEQFLAIHARNHGETKLSTIALSAAPCGHCRQFLYEFYKNNDLIFVTPNNQSIKLSELLPHPFGPFDLNVNENTNTKRKNMPSKSSITSLSEMAKEALHYSHAPYSISKSGIGLQLKDGEIFKGSYFENAAFNPSIPPLQAALIALVAANRSFKEISQVILAENSFNRISQKESTLALLKQISPEAEFGYLVLDSVPE